MDQKAWLYALAASGLVAGVVQQAQDAEAKQSKEPVECFGINSCKGTNSCGVGQNQLDLAQAIYKEKFKATKLGECAGTAEGSAKDGHLAWVKKNGKRECFKAGGFIYLKDKGGNLQIEDKSGVKTTEVKK